MLPNYWIIRTKAHVYDDIHINDMVWIYTCRYTCVPSVAKKTSCEESSWRTKECYQIGCPSLSQPTIAPLLPNNDRTLYLFDDYQLKHSIYLPDPNRSSPVCMGELLGCLTNVDPTIIFLPVGMLCSLRKKWTVRDSNSGEDTMHPYLPIFLLQPTQVYQPFTTF